MGLVVGGRAQKGAFELLRVLLVAGYAARPCQRFFATEAVRVNQINHRMPRYEPRASTPLRKHRAAIAEAVDLPGSVTIHRAGAKAGG